jgi:hypothetical protein
MFRPWLPPRLNLTGMALPALTVLIVGGLSTGGKKPVKETRRNRGMGQAATSNR